LSIPAVLHFWITFPEPLSLVNSIVKLCIERQSSKIKCNHLNVRASMINKTYLAILKSSRLSCFTIYSHQRKVPASFKIAVSMVRVECNKGSNRRTGSRLEIVTTTTNEKGLTSNLASSDYYVCTAALQLSTLDILRHI
jgi:hypothetical protein